MICILIDHHGYVICLVGTDYFRIFNEFSNLYLSYVFTADDATDLETENPFALAEAPQNEDLYIDDPKKALRGYFEREGMTVFAI